MLKSNHTDVLIVGAGIIGLAIAYMEAKNGKQVAVFDRSYQTQGASIRNFGMIWPIGQANGVAFDRAMRSRNIWAKVADEAGFWKNENGSLHLAYHEDEWAILQEFMETVEENGYDCKLLSPTEVSGISPASKTEGLIGALYSKTEMIVDPRKVPEKLTTYLADALGVKFNWGVNVHAISEKQMESSTGNWHFNKAYVCCGSDFETLFPEIFKETAITKCKLQMMRTAPQAHAWKMGPSICGGLTLAHYASFSHCESLQDFKKRIELESPWFNQWGIHVMMAQNGVGELIIGDSHEYGWSHDPFSREEINQHILDYLHRMVQAPDLSITERWHGIYAKLPGKTEFINMPFPNVTLVTGLSGAGMTLSFGLAEDLVSNRRILVE